MNIRVFSMPETMHEDCTRCRAIRYGETPATTLVVENVPGGTMIFLCEPCAREFGLTEEPEKPGK